MSLSEPKYAIEGSVFIAGAALQWCRDQLSLFDAYEDGLKLADSIDSSGGVIFVPAFSGLGSPHWDADVRGSILGLTAASRSAQIVRAALDAMVYQAQDVLGAMAESGVQIQELRVDGGAAANDRLMQLQSDVSGVHISRPVSIETTALGAAFLAGLAVGFWKNEAEIASLRHKDRDFKPSSQAHVATGSYLEWCEAIEMLLRGRESKTLPIDN
jgi:glycerol kinase